MTTTFQRPAQLGSVFLGVDDLGAHHAGPALLLAPGWCGNRDVFEPLACRLAGPRRTVVSDLRGHGDRAGDSADFTSADQVDDLVALADGLGLERFVPVLLSHAGWFGVELRRRLGPDRVPGVVLVDWMPLGDPPGFTAALAGLQVECAWEDVRSGLFTAWTEGVDVPEVHAYVESMSRYGFPHWRRAGREISYAYARHGSPLAAFAALGGCPVLHLYAQPADDDFLAAQQDAARVHPWFRVRRLDARSHFPMLEVPGDMAEAIEEFTCSLV